MKISVRVLLFTVLFCSARAQAGADDRLVLGDATIIVSPEEPSYVQYGVEELGAYLAEITGRKPVIAEAPPEGDSPLIVVGAKAAAKHSPLAPASDDLGASGYQLQATTVGDRRCLLVTGAAPQGTKLGLAELMKAIAAEGTSAYVDAKLDRKHKPAVPLRGLHFNGWAFNSPYSFRAWTEAEWKQYLDVMAVQGVNLFYLWPFIEIIPMPLSAEDREYLEECRRLVDYAHEKHGMEVWIMQCTNRVARDNCGVADPRRRPYWRPAQEDLNPGNPEHFRRILESREALYSIVNNVDGVCNIDSDPGYYPGSSLDEYLQVLKGCRELLDRHNVQGSKVKIISWMWEGWGLIPGRMGTKGRDQHELDTIAKLRADLPEPWGLVVARGSDVKLARTADVLSRSVFLPYGAIEGEPAYPGTNLSIDDIRNLFKNIVYRNPEMAGAMGNLQTPLLQFPNMYCYTSNMVDSAHNARSQQEVLAELAQHLYPEQQELIARCYASLADADADRIQQHADELGKVIETGALGRPGVFGRKLFPSTDIVARSLLLQLNYRAARQRLIDGADTVASVDDCRRLLSDYFDTYLAWDTAHGWHNLWGYDTWLLGSHIREKWFVDAASNLGRSLGEAEQLDACCGTILQELSKKYDRQAVEIGCIEPFKMIAGVYRPVKTLAQQSTASASVAPNEKDHPPQAAVDGNNATLYWPGALTDNNSEWLQLSWDAPRDLHHVTVRFLNHPSMRGRDIRLERELEPGHWSALGKTAIKYDPAAPFAVAEFEFEQPVSLDKLRIVNLLDVFEVEAN